MENKYLSKKKHGFHAMFVRNAYLQFKDEDESSPKSTIDLVNFKKLVCEELSHLSFSEFKDKDAQEIDHLRLYTELSWPTEPDIEVRLFLYQNPDATFFLEAIC